MPKIAFNNKTGKTAKLKKLARKFQVNYANTALENAVDLEHQLKFINPRSLREQLRTAMKQEEAEALICPQEK